MRSRRARASRSASVVMCRSERNGIRTSGTRSVDRRLAQVAEPQVEAFLDACRLARTSRATASIPADASTPITRTPAFAIGTAIRPVPHASSTTGPPGARASST